MAIQVNLDVMLARRKMTLSELAAKVDITLANLSVLKTGRRAPFASARWTGSAGRWTASRGNWLAWVPAETEE